MENKKLKMSNKKFMCIWIPIISVLLCLVIVATVVMNYFSTSMNTYLGTGERQVELPEGAEDWDLDYYEQQYDTISAAREENSAAVALKIAEEGITLLKNENVLPLDRGDAITPFGLRYLDPAYGGTGSGNVDVSMDYVDSAQEMMNEYFTVAETVESKLAAATHYYLPAPESLEAEATGWQDKSPNTDSETMFENHSWQDEYNPGEVYDSEFLAAAAGTTGVVFLGRVGGESNDIYYGQYGAYADGTEHALQLNSYEKETIKLAKEVCDSVIVVLETSNVMEISELAEQDGELSVDGIIWMGGAGAKGFQGLAKIMAGEVNPSGHLTDTWMASIKDDPTSVNFGEFLYSNLEYGDIVQSMVEYDEGIYMGYRYYETVADLGGTFEVAGQTLEYGELNEAGAVVTPGAVVYPFGYGLSYGTDFEQKITAVDENETEVTLEVTVTNNGTDAGKAVVQLYYGAPYTKLDEEYLIEKSTVNLTAYDKTGEIPAGGSEVVTITIRKEDMASYCYTRENPDGTIGCYMLEEGDYILSVRAGSHTVYDEISVTVDETIWYDGSDDDHIRQSEKDAQDTAGGSEAAAEYIAATNQFQESNDHMIEKEDRLSRASGQLLFTVQPPSEEDLIAEDGVLEAVNTTEYFDPETDEELGNTGTSKIYAEEAPVTNADGSLTVSDMRGVPYDDEKWDELLDQLDLSSGSDVWSTLLASAYSISEISSVGKPATSESDGPQGISSMYGDPEDFGCAWCSAPILAATFNVELAYEMGAAVGQEALAKGVSAWYAPGINTHRSAFSGRNFECYSEDPILAGYMATYVTSGAADNGLSTVIKHLFLNDMETNRNHLNTWCDEQAMREIYLKAFELPIKEAVTTLNYISDDEGTRASRVVRASTGIMTSMGSIGTDYCGTSYQLCTNVLYNEMGFRGMIMTDMAENAYNSKDKMIRAGVAEYMYFTDASASDLKDYQSATMQTAMRKVVKDMCYMVANNSAMQGAAPGTIITYTMAPWQIGLVAGYVVTGLLAMLMTFLTIRRRNDAKQYPEKYKSSAGKKKNA